MRGPQRLAAPVGEAATNVITPTTGDIFTVLTRGDIYTVLRQLGRSCLTTSRVQFGSMARVDPRGRVWRAERGERR
jgi:hypothetical protein